ncbi:MAG: putative transcriptional regulator [Candidatus Poriferisodalaceae bacterium]
MPERYLLFRSWVRDMGALWPFIESRCMLICMQSTSVRIDTATHEQLKRLAEELNTTVGNTVSLAVRALRQDRVGANLAAPLRDDELAWLDADLG